MYIIEKSASGSHQLEAEAKLLSQRKIYVEGEITPELACDFSRKVLVACSQDRRRPIDVIINSNGGEINSGLMMYDIMQSCGVPIRTFCQGRAWSMAAILFACGTGGRYMLPNSQLLLHEPQAPAGVAGSCSSVQAQAQNMLATKGKICELLSRHTHRGVEEISEACSYDHFFTAEESVEFGLCDEIVGFDKLMEV